jgi:hypothetical protein
MTEEIAHETEREGAYFVIMLAIMGNQWLERPEEEDEIELFDYQREAIESALLVSMDSGALADAGVSDKTIAAICEEWQIPNVVETWSVLR